MRIMPSTLNIDSKYSILSVFLMNDFIVEHLRRLRPYLEGDLDCALILGDIAHFNVSQITSCGGFIREYMERSMIRSRNMSSYSESPELGPLIKTCNALSISESTGIPRETVRRKIKWLEERGWIERNANGSLCITTLPANEFRQFNLDTLNEFLATADRIKTLLEQESKEKKSE